MWQFFVKDHWLLCSNPNGTYYIITYVYAIYFQISCFLRIVYIQAISANTEIDILQWNQVWNNCIWLMSKRQNWVKFSFNQGDFVVENWTNVGSSCQNIAGSGHHSFHAMNKMRNHFDKWLQNLPLLLLTIFLHASAQHDKKLHAQKSMGWDYLSIPELQRLRRWSLGMDK